MQEVYVQSLSLPERVRNKKYSRLKFWKELPVGVDDAETGGPTAA